MTAVRTWCHQNQNSHPNPTGAVQGRGPAARTGSHRGPGEGSTPAPGPTLLPQPSLHRASSNEGAFPPGGSSAGRGSAPCPPVRGSCPPLLPYARRPRPRAPSAAAQRRRQLAGGCRRQTPRVKSAPKALRYAQKSTGSVEGHEDLCSKTLNAPLVRTVRAGNAKGINTGNEREATRGRDGSRGPAPHPSRRELAGEAA